MSERNVIGLFTREPVGVDSKTGELTDLPELSKKLDTHLDMLVLTDLLEKLAQFKRQGFLKQENINLRRELVRNYKDEELFTWINSSTSQGWQVRPSFYAAVYEELLSRGLTTSGTKRST